MWKKDNTFYYVMPEVGTKDQTSWKLLEAVCKGKNTTSGGGVYFHPEANDILFLCNVQNNFQPEMKILKYLVRILTYLEYLDDCCLNGWP